MDTYEDTLEQLNKRIKVLEEKLGDRTGTLKFNLDEHYCNNDFKRASKANDAFYVLWEIQQRLFRPSYKHGYDKQMEDLLDKTGTSNSEGDFDYELRNGDLVIERLMEMFHQILDENNISLDECCD